MSQQCLDSALEQVTSASTPTSVIAEPRSARHRLPSEQRHAGGLDSGLAPICTELMVSKCDGEHVSPQEEYGDINAYYSTKADVQHMWGFQHVLSTWHMGDEFFWQCKKARDEHAVMLAPVSCLLLMAHALG